MRSTKPATNQLAPFDVQALLDLRRDAYQSYARSGDDVAPRFATAIVNLELELMRRTVSVESPREPDVPLCNLNEALQRPTALRRIRRAARKHDVETVADSIPYLAPDDMPEAWHSAYACRGDLIDLYRLLERVFVTALAHREGWDAARAVCEDLLESKTTLTSAVTTLECALRDLLKVGVPMDALIGTFGRWREHEE